MPSQCGWGKFEKLIFPLLDYPYAKDVLQSYARKSFAIE